MTTPAETWRAERRERLIANLLAARPAAFAQPGELVPAVAAWADGLAAGDSRNLVITGPVGQGKTWTIWHAAERAVRAGYEGQVRVITAAGFRRIVAPSTADVAEFERLAAAGLLVVDDLGAARLSDWDLDHLGELIDIRWSQQLPVAVTSNKPKLRELVGPRIASRLADRAVIAELDGPDRRRQR